MTDLMSTQMNKSQCERRGRLSCRGQPTREMFNSHEEISIVNDDLKVAKGK